MKIKRTRSRKQTNKVTEANGEGGRTIQRVIDFLCVFLPITLAKRAAAIKMIAAGLSDCRVTELTGLCNGSVRYLRKALRERFVVALTRYGMSAANITAFAEEVFGYSISSGTIWNILKEASRKAETLEKDVSLENVKHIATDEVFQNGEPVLTGVDLDSGYVFLTEAAPDRSAGTWKAANDILSSR